MYLLYNILLLCALPFIIGYHLYRSVSRGRPAALLERFGFVDQAPVLTPGGPPPIWVHAVSVGETIAVRPLLKALKERFPERLLVLSNMTETGRVVAQEIPWVDHCIRFPFDYPWAVRRLLRQIDPGLVVIVETELWPNFLREARNRSIPTLIANGRISDRSFGRYLKARRLFRPVLDTVGAFCMQSSEDARRIIAIGADEARVQVARNLKFDIPVGNVSAAERLACRLQYRLPEAATVIVAGSTHPGEEGQVVAAFSRLVGAGKEAVLVLVPRHPERAAEVADLLQQAGLAYVRRSSLAGREAELAAGEVLLVDTIGELMRLYGLADVAFVGGSLVPVGGHNVLEPASLGVPVIIGPHMTNFREISALVLAADAALQVADGEQLAMALTTLLDDAARRAGMGENGRRLVLEQGGATARHLAAIEQCLRGEA
ncbi:MAG: 3-deoxy-D-manno-octulosonic acid transferase [Geobacter sp.]|nr:3-deoxy-D-manno-octulosonic acid transferase [Geobacter sp.]